MRDQIISQLKQDKDFDEVLLKDTRQGFITSNGEILLVWKKKFESTEAYQVLRLDSGVKIVVFNDSDETDCTYAFVNDLLVRHKKDADYLEVYQLSFKQGKLEEGAPVG